MIAPPLPDNELQRMRSLRALGILDTDPEERFDRLTRLARRLFDVPVALVSLVDADRQWFKSRVGLDVEETPREQAFCAHTILQDEVMVVRDAAEDERFRGNPLVTRSPRIRFYAGCPVKAPDGSALGVLCVISHEPRDLAEDDALVLRDLAGMVEEELKSRALATTDELTGIANRRGFETIAEHSLAMARRLHRPATLLLFDLDGFKTVNDTLGHLAGDRLLQRFAKELLATFRDSDVVARLGGDEFCVLLSGASEPDVGRPLESLERRLQKPSGKPGVAFSVGAVTYDPGRHAGVGMLLKDADARMYLQKRAAG